MRNGRLLALALLAALTFGSLLTSGGYAWYLRSARYRDRCAAALSTALGLPADIGQVAPRSCRAREFDQVRIWLPARRGEAAFCERAILTQTPTPDEPEAYELDLRDGHCEISTRTWLGEDYRRVLESGLRPGFEPTGPRRVVFGGMDLTFQRDGFRAGLHDAGGVVYFDAPERGRATVTCEEFNGYTVAKPVMLYAEFSPQPPGIRLDRVDLLVPELPVAVVGLADLAGLDLRSGRFSGRLVYREMGDQRELTVSGKALQIDLAECTGSLLPRPWRGSAPEIELQELRLVNGRPERLRFRGVFTDAVGGDVLAPWGLTDVGGKLVLRVHAADLSPAGIQHFVASGRCDDLALERVSDAIGWGRMSGTARVVIEDLTVNENRLAALDAEITVSPPNGQPDWIERGLLSEVFRRSIGIPLPSFLPDRFEYTQLGVRLEVRDELLYVFGTHGPRGKTILSVSIGGQEVPVVFEPENSFDLHAALDHLRARLTTHIEQRLLTLTPAEARRYLSGPLPRFSPTPSTAPDGPRPE